MNMFDIKNMKISATDKYIIIDNLINHNFYINLIN